MEIKSVVIHEVIKKENTTEAQNEISVDYVNPKNVHVNRIINDLEMTFQKKTIGRAKLLDDRGFQIVIDDFNRFDLLESSKALTRLLTDNMQSISPAKGGYLVFCLFKNNHNFLAVFLVRNSLGSLLNFKSDKTWDVDSTQYLDTKNFAMGVKINLDLIQSGNDVRYVSLVKGTTDVAGYFETWIGVDSAKSETKDADALYEISKQVDLPSNVESREELQKAIFDFVKSQPNNTVNLRALSTHLYEDEDYLVSYCLEHDVDIDGEFKVSNKSLNQFYKVSVKADGIELSAPKSKFNPEDIHFVNGDSIIIHSRELVEKLREAL